MLDDLAAQARSKVESIVSESGAQSVGLKREFRVEVATPQVGDGFNNIDNILIKKT